MSCPPQDSPMDISVGPGMGPPQPCAPPVGPGPDPAMNPNIYSGRAVRPISGLPSAALYTILGVSLFEFFAYWGFFAHTPLLGCVALISWCACIVSMCSVAAFSKGCQIASIVCRIIAFVLVLITMIIAVLIMNCTIHVMNWFCEHSIAKGGPTIAWTVGSIVVGTVFLFSAINVACHVYLTIWITRGCPGAPPPRPDYVMAPAYVVAPRPMVVGYAPVTPRPVIVAEADPFY